MDKEMETATLKAYPDIYKTLTNDIARYKYLLRRNLPEKLLGKLDEAIEDLKAHGYFDKRVRTGDKAPDFTLQTCRNNTFSLSEALKKSPVVLSFFRGRWCGYDTRELQYQQHYHTQIQEQAARLVSISPALPEYMREVTQEYGLKFDILRDEYNRVAKMFGVAYPLPEIVQSVYEAGGLYIEEENGEDSLIIPLPTTYIINQEGEVVFDFYHPDYTVRVEPKEIVDFLRTSKTL